MRSGEPTRLADNLAERSLYGMFPRGHASEGAQVMLAGRSADDLWLYNPKGGQALHGNGIGWEARPTGLSGMSDLWVDETGSAWVLGSRMDESPGVLRWDLATGAWRRLPTPTDLSAVRVVGCPV